MRRKDIRALLVAEFELILDIHQSFYPSHTPDRRRIYGIAQRNTLQHITNVGARFGRPRRAYRETRDAGSDDMVARGGIQSSYGVCSAANGGRHARPDEGICPRCGEEVTT